MKKTSKKLLSAALTFILAVLMAFQLPAQVFADSKPEYISEIKISIATGKKDSQKSAAQKELTDAGYTLLTHLSDYTKDGKTVFKKGDAVDMNYGTDVALTSEPPAVYLGYKTTTDKDKAITDISMMEMAKESDKNQPYSFAAYDEMLKEYKKEINASVANIEDTLTEFSSNYKKGSPAAKWAYEQLNRYTDPDIEKNNKIGDILLAMVSGGFSDDEKEQIQNYFLKSNINFVNTMNVALGVGCAEYKSDDTWIERFAASDPDEEYKNSYDDTVSALLSGWQSFYDALYAFKKTGLSNDCTGEELNDYLSKNSMQSDSEAAIDVSLGATAAHYLAKYEYNGESMVEFFLQNRDSDNIDKEALVPLANALTKGQRATVESIGLRGLFSGLDNTDARWTKITDKTDDLIEDCGADADDTVSIYAGVNEAMYSSDGVALTSEAMTNNAASEDSGLFSSGFNTVMFACGIVTIAVGLSGFTYILTNMVRIVKSVSLESEEGFWYVWKHVSFPYKNWTTFGKVTLYISIGAELIGAGLTLGSFVYNYYHSEYTKIPTVMVDSKTTKNNQGIESTHYVYYDSVKCDYDNQTNIPADTNAWTGKRWNAMFVTKDENAGDAILAKEFCAQYGSNEKSGYTAVARFHEKNAYNMNAHHYGDDANGIYLFYKADDGTASYEGTSISSANLGLGIGGGAIGGIIIGALGVNTLNKKKKEKEQKA